MVDNYETVAPPAFIYRRTASSVLDGNHLTAFRRAVTNILSTPIAEETFAQIIDGLPLADVAFGTRGSGWTIFDPVVKHEVLCPGVREKLRSIREAFDLNTLMIDHRVLQQYQDIPDGSGASRLPLFELVAVTIHVMAITLFNKNDSLHKDSTLMGEIPYDDLPRRQPILSPFALGDYSDPSQYPDGVNELPGYWAEDRIFGGVVLFARGTNADQIEEIWYHSHRKDVTRRLYALTYAQRLAFYNFLRAEPDELPPCPLPILGDQTNRDRVDPEIAIPQYNIYRDRWERKIPVSDYSDYLRKRRDVIEAIDYPELYEDEFPRD